MRTTLLTIAALIALVPSPGRAADPPKLVGDWEGTMKVTDAISLTMVFHVKEAAGKLSATFDSPDQGVLGLAVKTAEQVEDAVSLDVPTLKGQYKGKIAADGSKIEGEWTQLGKSYPLALARTTAKAQPPAKPDQIWEGPLALQGGIEIRLVINLFKQADGAFKATLDSPDQGAKGIKVETATLDKKALAFKVPVLGAEFSGTLDDAGTEAKGTFQQLGQSLPLTLKRTDKPSEGPKRTQVPKPPFPYREIEVEYPNKEAGLSLAGTFTVPEGPGPFPSVVLISGSGPQDRDETLLGHKPFLVLADDLTRKGIAVLRFDDRGVGKSTGDHGKATSVDFASDVKAGVAFLKTRKEADPKKIGLMGHSEGGLIAPMVAADLPDDIAFLVLLAGPGVPGDEILFAQSALIAKALGGKPEAIEKSVAQNRKIFAAIRTQTDPAALEKALDVLTKELLANLSADELKELGKDPTKTVEGQLNLVKTPWFRYFLSYDPRPTLAKVKCPVLAVNGEKDLQVPPGQSLPEIEKALKAGGNAKFTIREFPGLNHLFQTCKTGSPAEYSKIEETFSPDALKVIGDWIVETTR